jgi:hypothetical protein
VSQTLQEIVEVIIDKGQWVGGPVDDADGLDVAVFRPTEPVAGLARIMVCLDLDDGEALVAYTVHDETTICAAPLKSAAAMRWLAGRVAALRTHGAAAVEAPGDPRVRAYGSTLRWDEGVLAWIDRSPAG